ncbi:hypothetical protein CHS0354_041753 [Potamilus streckersoni]|uniref:Uncharacterized protein n=1 Tax=Potamilus streckersoni TaxID=2493646 RepID=A0AAE0T1K2_9BIVA|nr:hypothetical protein CHS0354_041753 [Potamilus streckersoni]
MLSTHLTFFRWFPVRHSIRCCFRILTGLVMVVLVSLAMAAFFHPPMIKRAHILVQGFDSQIFKNKILQKLFSDTFAGRRPLVETELVHIGFVKVHKAASSTTQNIFLRFGYLRNLTFVLPPEKNAFSWPNIISLNESMTTYNIVPPPPGRHFDIVCHHVLYERESFQKFLPNDTAIIGTVREPFSLFKSMLRYMQPSYVMNINGDQKVSQFLRNTFLYEPQNLAHSMTNNRMAFEYGCPSDIIIRRDISAFKDYLRVLDKDFAVVLLAEKFDESLVLMKRHLHWTLKDILYAKLNVLKSNQDTQDKDTFPLTVDPDDEPWYRNHSILDYYLYDFFKNRLERQIDAAGPDFAEETEQFKTVRKEVEHFCHSTVKDSDSIRIKQSPWNEEFDVTIFDCELMHKYEITFTTMIRERQYNMKSTWSYK